MRLGGARRERLHLLDAESLALFFQLSIPRRELLAFFLNGVTNLPRIGLRFDGIVAWVRPNMMVTAELGKMAL